MPNLLIHLKHFRDGYPLCWPMDREGEFEGTSNEAKVTCPDCLALMANFTEEGG